MSSHEKLPGKIKITIVKITVPGDRNQGSTHQTVDRTRIETRIKLSHIVVQIVRFDQPLAEPAQGHIGKIKQVVENNPPFSFQNLSESLFCLSLIGREKRAGGVGYQAQLQAGTLVAVPHGIQLFKGIDGCLKNTVASL